MSDETIWLVLRVTQTAIPVAWRMSEDDAVATCAGLRSAWSNTNGFAHFMVVPCSNTETP